MPHYKLHQVGQNTALCHAQVVAGLRMQLLFTVDVKCSGRAAANTLFLDAVGFFPLGGGAPPLTSVVLSSTAAAPL